MIKVFYKPTEKPCFRVLRVIILVSFTGAGTARTLAVGAVTGSIRATSTTLKESKVISKIQNLLKWTSPPELPLQVQVQLEQLQLEQLQVPFGPHPQSRNIVI